MDLDQGGQSIGTRALLATRWIEMHGKISLKCTVGTSHECHRLILGRHAIQFWENYLYLCLSLSLCIRVNHLYSLAPTQII